MIVWVKVLITSTLWLLVPTGPGVHHWREQHPCPPGQVAVIEVVDAPIDPISFVACVTHKQLRDDER